MDITKNFFSCKRMISAFSHKAYNILNRTIQYKDLIQIFSIVFIQASQSYTSKDGGSFPTYAYACINHRFLTLIKKYQNKTSYSKIYDKTSYKEFLNPVELNDKNNISFLPQSTFESKFISNSSLESIDKFELMDYCKKTMSEKELELIECILNSSEKVYDKDLCQELKLTKENLNCLKENVKLKLSQLFQH